MITGVIGRLGLLTKHKCGVSGGSRLALTESRA
jgi:hypothetical protein